jgi:hypothetical protein
VGLDSKINFFYIKIKLDRHSWRGLIGGETKERWQQLCEQATTEQDSQKVVELVQEINDLLEQRQGRSQRKDGDEPHVDQLIPQQDNLTGLDSAMPDWFPA